MRTAAFFVGGKANGTWMQQPVLVQSGRSANSETRAFGDYSATTMDPNDDSFWTIQEFSSFDVQFPQAIWGTWIMRINP